MINFQNKNHSLLAISKHRKKSKIIANSTLYKLLSPNHRSILQSRLQETQHNLTYISPDLQENSLFKSKLHSYLKRDQHSNKIIFRSKRMENPFSISSESFQALKKSLNNEKIDRRKNIREYMCQLSLDKRKNFGNKTVQLGQIAIKQQKTRSNPMLIIRKIKQISDKRYQTNKSPQNAFIERHTPIHNTQIYYFSKKRSRTEPLDLRQQFINNESRQKKHVTLSRICQLRQHLRQQQKERQERDKELILINEIHPTIAIITTRQLDSKYDDKPKDMQTTQKAPSLFNALHQQNVRQEQSISPWAKKNHQENQFY